MMLVLFLFGVCAGIMLMWFLDLFFDAFGRRHYSERRRRKAWTRGFLAGTESAFDCQINVLLEEAKTHPALEVRVLYAKWLTFLGPLKRKAVATLKKREATVE